MLIPVYKEFQRVETTLNKLKSEGFSGRYEVIIAADCVDAREADRFRKLGARVFMSRKRIGKVQAINSASKKARGELLVFLDSDTEPVSQNFLSEIWSTYQKHKYDIATGKIRIDCKRRLHEMASIDYLFSNSAISLADRMGEIPALNGAFFVMKRESFKQVGRFSPVVVEDLDIAVKAYQHNMTFRFFKQIEVLTDAPSNMREWIKQRRRWILGGLNSLGDQGKKTAIKKAPFSVAALMTAYPFSFTALVWTLLLIFLPYPLTITSVFAISYVSTSGMMFFLNRLMEWNISLGPALNYILLYSPLWSIFIFAMIFASMFEKNPEIEDWVV